MLPLGSCHLEMLPSKSVERHKRHLVGYAGEFVTMYPSHIHSYKVSNPKQPHPASTGLPHSATLSCEACLHISSHLWSPIDIQKISSLAIDMQTLAGMLGLLSLVFTIGTHGALVHAGDDRAQVLHTRHFELASYGGMLQRVGLNHRLSSPPLTELSEITGATSPSRPGKLTVGGKRRLKKAIAYTT